MLDNDHENNDNRHAHHDTIESINPCPTCRRNFCSITKHADMKAIETKKHEHSIDQNTIEDMMSTIIKTIYKFQ